MIETNQDIRELAEQSIELEKKSSQVVQWYPHSQYDGYHPGKASVRGPFGRWLLIEGGENDGKLGYGIADLYDDAKYCAHSMNYAALISKEYLKHASLMQEKDKEIERLNKILKSAEYWITEAKGILMRADGTEEKIIERYSKQPPLGICILEAHKAVSGDAGEKK